MHGIVNTELRRLLYHQFSESLSIIIWYTRAILTDSRGLSDCCRLAFPFFMPALPLSLRFLPDPEQRPKRQFHGSSDVADAVNLLEWVFSVLLCIEHQMRVCEVGQGAQRIRQFFEQDGSCIERCVACYMIEDTLANCSACTVAEVAWKLQARACAPCIVFLDELDAVGYWLRGSFLEPDTLF